MKYQKTLATLAGLSLVGGFMQAQIAIGENVTISGFVTGSYTNVDNGQTVQPAIGADQITAGGNAIAGTTAGDDKSVGIDQVEIDFAFDYDAIKAEVHLDANSTDVRVEQAFLSTNVGQFTITGGRMLNLLGFESDEPTGLRTMSKAYSLYDFPNTTISQIGADGSAVPGGHPDYSYDNDNDGDDTTYSTGASPAGDYELNGPVAIGYNNYDIGKRYNEGLRVGTTFGDFSIAGSVLDSLYYDDSNAAQGDADELAYEIQAKYTGIENLLIAIGYAEDGDTKKATGATSTNIATAFNIFGYYNFGQLGIAAEYNDMETGDDRDVNSYLIQGDYDLNDKIGFTIRYSDISVDDQSTLDIYAIEANAGSTTVYHMPGDMNQITFAGTYNVTNNFLLRAEYTAGELDGSVGDDSNIEEGWATAEKHGSKGAESIDLFALQGILSF